MTLDAFGPYPVLSVGVLVVSLFALWHRSTVGWIVACIANAAMVFLIIRG